MKWGRKGRLVLLFILLVVFLGEACPVFAGDWQDSLYQEQWDQSGAQEFLDSLPREATDPLYENGLTPENWDTLAQEGGEEIWQLLLDSFLDQFRSPLRSALQIVGVLILCSLVGAIQSQGKHLPLPETMELTGTLASMMLFLTPVSGLIVSACEGIRQGTGILLGGAPVLCGILTASGHTFSGSTLSIFTVAAGNVGSLLASAFLVPVLQAFLALSSVSCLYPKLRLQAFCSALLKAVRWTLVFVVSIYSALLSMQGTLASSADAASLKAVRLSVSSFVPVVGSAVSDAMSAVQASMGLLRGGLGSFAILTLLVLFVPGMIAGGLWILASCLLGGACELFSLSQVKPFFTSCRDVLQTLLAFQISFCVIAVTSFALLLSTGGTSG